MGYLKLKDTGAHSVGINNNSGKQIIRARPECIVVNPLTVSVSGGTAGSPQVQHAANGLISAGTELWFRLAGSNELVKGTVGGVAVSGAGPYTYTLTDIVPALASLPVSAFRLRADATKAMMALACGALDEPLCGETPLDLVGTGTTASQVAIASPSSILAYLAATNLCRDLLITSGGVETAMTPHRPRHRNPRGISHNPLVFEQVDRRRCSPLHLQRDEYRQNQRELWLLSRLRRHDVRGLLLPGGNRLLADRGLSLRCPVQLWRHSCGICV